MQLNAEQLAVIDGCTKNQLVMAPAGTGKTTVISKMIDRLCREHGVPESAILCITFTNRAKSEMLSKIQFRDIEVRTIHSMYYHIVQLNYNRLGYSSQNITIGTPQAMQDFTERLAREKGAPNLGRAKSYLFCQSVLRALEGERKLGEALMFVLCNKKSRRELGLNAFEEFEAWLRRNGVALLQAFLTRSVSEDVIDFSLMEYFCWNLSRDPVAVQCMDNKHFVLIDEIQDTTKVEYDILIKFFGEAVISLFGDFNQTIYQWRGSDPKYIRLEFLDRFHPIETALLDNYRSTPEIQYWSQSFLDSVYSTDTHLSLPTPTVKLPVYLAGHQYGFTAVRIIQGWHKQNPAGKYAVLARNRTSLDEVKSAWLSMNTTEPLPFTIGVPHEFEVNDSETMRLFRDMVGLAALPFNEFLINRILSKFNINKQSDSSVYSYLISGLYELQIGSDYYADLDSAISTTKNLWVFDLETTAKSIAEARIVQFAAVNPITHEKLEWIINPHKPVGDSYRVHGFSDAFLREAGVELKEALAEIYPKLNGCVVAGHNVWYDITVLNEELARCEMPALEFLNVYDTLLESRRLLKSLNLANFKLDTVRKALQVREAPTHNAMADVTATLRVLAVLFAKYIRPHREVLHTEMLQDFTVNKFIISQLRVCVKHILNGEYESVLRWCSDVIGSHSYQTELDYINSVEYTASTPRCRAAELYDYLTLNKSEIDILMNRHGKIPAITIHQSKGCEFDRVILLDVIRQRWGGADELDAEEMRVFYVGMTRAKQELVLVSNMDSHYTAGARIEKIPQECLEFRKVGLSDGQPIDTTGPASTHDK